MSSGMIDKTHTSFSKNRSEPLPENSSVFAAENLPKGTLSKSFQIEEDGFLRKSGSVIQVGIHKGFLDTTQFVKNWYKYINFGSDIHSANVYVDIIPNIDKNQNLILEVVKNINKNEELFLWFSEKFAAVIDLPFLTPKNIIGYKKYRCHTCDKNFEHPNPLKLHLFMSCDEELQSSVWKRVLNVSNKKYTKAPSLLWNNVQQLSSTMKNENNKCISEPSNSAFLPYKKIFKSKKEVDISPVLQQPLNLAFGSTISHAPTIINQNSIMNNILGLKLTQSLEEMSGNYAADVELFASNWGKLKQGHLCVYCGKIYSRKYGLKIHIRTHTGYKPLKCKYCLRPFGDPSNLNKHVRLHASTLTQYMCSLCGKVLVRRRDLERHLKSHQGNNIQIQDMKESNSD